MSSDKYALIANLIPKGARVLDVGCGWGALGGALRQHGCQLIGIDNSVHALRQVGSSYSALALLDLESSASATIRDLGVFDVVVLADVLEHLAQPETLLRKLRELIGPDGSLITSVPNVARWRNRWDLLRGRWDYQEAGLLDRTHLRFFTLRTAKALLHAAGFRVVKTCFPHAPAARRFSHARWALTLVRPGLFAECFVFAAQLPRTEE